MANQIARPHRIRFFFWDHLRAKSTKQTLTLLVRNIENVSKKVQLKKFREIKNDLLADFLKYISITEILILFYYSYPQPYSFLLT